MIFNFQGDEKLIVEGNKLKKIIGFHLTDENNNDIICDIEFYNTYIQDDGIIFCDTVEIDGKQKIWEISYYDN